MGPEGLVRARRATGRRGGPLGVFIDEEGGFTTVTVAVSVLMSLVLVLTLVQIRWISSRAADVQKVADATALSGTQVVRCYATVAQVADACVLTLGIAGLFVIGAGFTACLVPGLQGAGLSAVEEGAQIMDARRDFATSCAENLRRLEACVSALIAADSFATAEANTQGSAAYWGIALPFPREGESDFDLPEDVGVDRMRESAESMAQASEGAQEAQRRVRDALERGWRADCGGEVSMRSRASDLAHLSDADNPGCAHPEGWDFGMALARARAYYRARAALETPVDESAREVSNSKMRAAFYDYALAELAEARYEEHADGSVVVDLPELAHTPDLVRQSRLYREVRWPCSDEGGRTVIHAWSGCPGIRGPLAGEAVLADVDGGAVQVCDVCDLSVTQMGNVAAATTNSTSGFEHYWQEVVEASRQWSRAAEDLDAAEAQMRRSADGGADLFEQALEAFSTPRPTLRPPGCWGCVALVGRGEAASPAELSSTLVGAVDLPAGVAISAATLAPDAASDANNVLSRLFDFASQGEDGGIEGVLQGITGLWGQLLLSYGGAADGLADIGDTFHDGLEAVGMGSVAQWLGERLTALVDAFALAPADLRLKKPVLCASQDVLDKDGSTSGAEVRRYLEALPESDDPRELLGAFGGAVLHDIRDEEFTIAELPIPGTSRTIPLTITLAQLGVA